MHEKELKTTMKTIGMWKNDKSVSVIRCYFCINAKIDNSFVCMKDFIPADDCESFSKVNDIERRVNEIFDNLSE